MKKTLAIILAILMIVTTMPMAFAASIRYSGSLEGGNGKYELDSDGVLTISGEGGMGRFSFYYTTDVKEIIIEDGITSVDYNAFTNYSNLTSIYIADSVETIGSMAFYNCKASKIYIGSGVKTIGNSAFYKQRTSSSDTGAVVVHYNGTQEMWNAVTVDSGNTLNVHYLEKGETVPATCVDPGYSSLVCATCGYNISTDVVPATGEHTRVNDICTVCGDGCVHSYVDGVCTICSIECKHDWMFDYCKNCGLKGGNLSNGFVWKLNLTTGVFTVTGVGAMPTVYNSDNSYYANQVKTIVVAEGITSVGDYAFSNFSSSAAVLIPSSVKTMSKNAFSGTAHYFGAKEDLTLTGYGYPTIHYCEERAGFDATCTVDGAADGWYCATCAKYVAGGEAIPAAHKLVAVEAQAKTCTEAGWEAYEYCTECDYTTKVEILASHEIEKVEAKTPTCSEIGWEAYEYCTECDYTTYKEIPASHKLVAVKAQAKTCTEAGWDAYEYCTECEYSTKVEIPASHDIATAEAKAPTCTEAGWDAYDYCTACDYTTKVELPVVDHADADADGKCDIGGEDIACPDCGRPVHDDTLVQKFVCWIIMLVNLIKSMF